MGFYHFWTVNTKHDVSTIFVYCIFNWLNFESIVVGKLHTQEYYIYVIIGTFIWMEEGSMRLSHLNFKTACISFPIPRRRYLNETQEQNDEIIRCLSMPERQTGNICQQTRNRTKPFNLDTEPGNGWKLGTIYALALDHVPWIMELKFIQLVYDDVLKWTKSFIFYK